MLHRNIKIGYSDSLKLEVVESVMQGMTKHTAAMRYNIAECVVLTWMEKFMEGGEEALLADNRGRPKMGRKPKPKLSDYEPGSVEYLKLENEMMKRELRLLKKRCP